MALIRVIVGNRAESPSPRLGDSLVPAQSLRVLLVATRSRAAAELAWVLAAQGQHVTLVWESAHAQVEIRARNYDCVLVERDAFPDTAIVIRALRAGNAVPIVLVAAWEVVDERCMQAPTLV